MATSATTDQLLAEIRSGAVGSESYSRRDLVGRFQRVILVTLLGVITAVRGSAPATPQTLGRRVRRRELRARE